MTASEDLNQINSFLQTKRWCEEPFSVSFLAAGEYNANYLVDAGDGRFVLRINHGSQLGLGRNQIVYEYNVLQALAETGVTPLPIRCHPDPEPLGGGVLLMSYLPGKPLDYSRDLERAAILFSKIHTAPVPEGLLVQADPVMDIAQESEGLIHRFADHPMKKERSRIQAYRDEVLELADRTRTLFAGEALCLVNSEVNSGNFIVNETGTYLVDWEKAVASFRYQDLGHFLVPTTTLWKSETLLTPEEKDTFLAAYQRAAGLDLDLDEIALKTNVIEKAILLRALSWCFMAWYEYTQTDRPLQNPDTFAKINQYLADIPWILKSVT
jgi:aminoglycoside phosphotransferase (APT) family kinase protein